MRVLLVSTGSGSQGGGEFYIYLLGEALWERGHDVHISIPAHDRMSEMCKRCKNIATVHRVDAKNTYDRLLRNVGALLDAKSVKVYRKLFVDIDPDIIHINQQVLEDGFDVIRAAGSLDYPVVLTTHVTRSARNLGARFGALRDYISEHVIRSLKYPIVTVSDSSSHILENRLRKMRGSSTRVRVIYNGVNTPHRFSLEEIKVVRDEWGFGDKIPVIGVVGRIEHQKNPLLFARILGGLKDRGLSFGAVWVGDGQMRDDLMDQITRFGLGASFRVDGWRNDVDMRLQAIDIFVLPSRFEGLPFSLQEAMWAGLPVCVANVDGMREVVEDGVNGYLCRGENIELWVSRVSSLIKDKTRRCEMGRISKKYAEKYFSKNKMVNSTIEIYSETIAASKRVV